MANFIKTFNIFQFELFKILNYSHALQEILLIKIIYFSSRDLSLSIIKLAEYVDQTRLGLAYNDSRKIAVFIIEDIN